MGQGSGEKLGRSRLDSSSWCSGHGTRTWRRGEPVRVGSWPVHREKTAICRGQDVDGNPVEVVGTGLLARCLQHETDHLNGTVFGDRLSTRVRKSLYAAHEQLAHLYPEDWPITPRRTSA